MRRWLLMLLLAPALVWAQFRTGSIELIEESDALSCTSGVYGIWPDEGTSTTKICADGVTVAVTTPVPTATPVPTPTPQSLGSLSDVDLATATPAADDHLAYDGASWVPATPAAGGSGYDTIDDEDTPLTQRSTLNFAGAGVTCADDTTQTTCTISGSGSPLTTKGDLFTFDTSDARLPVGTDGHVLTADSAEATGIKWAAASGGSGATLVRKTSTESVSNSTTLQDDDALLFALGANEVWKFEFIINVDGPSNADMKVGVKGPTGVGGFFTVSGMELTVASTPGYEQTSASTGISASPSGVSVGVLPGGHTVRIYGLAVNGGTAGNITLQWAQNAGNATATNVTVNSHLIAYRVS